MSLRMYFWKDEKVFTISVADWDARSWERVIRDYQIHDCDCVDERASVNPGRYGNYYQDTDFTLDWVSRDKELLDPRFMLALLLLGVS